MEPLASLLMIGPALTPVRGGLHEPLDCLDSAGTASCTSWCEESAAWVCDGLERAIGATTAGFMACSFRALPIPRGP